MDNLDVVKEEPVEITPVKRGRGRPKGSKNKPKIIAVEQEIVEQQ